MGTTAGWCAAARAGSAAVLEAHTLARPDVDIKLHRCAWFDLCDC